MVKFVILTAFIVALVAHSEAFGIVRVDIQQDNGAQFANAINDAITSKIQSWNNILNSLLQVKTSTATVSGTATTNVNSGSAVSGTAAVAPLYSKFVTVNSGYASAGPPSGQVAATISDTENEVTPAPLSTTTGAVAGGAASGGTTYVKVYKAYGGIPSAAVLAAGSPASQNIVPATGTATVLVPAPAVYTYRKSYLYG